MMAPLPPALAQRIDPMIRRLSTTHEGERLATIAALERVLAAGKASFHDLADAVAAGAKPAERGTSPRQQPMPDDAFAAVNVLLQCRSLSAWETNFLESVGRHLRRGRWLSDKQQAVVERLWSKYAGRS